VCEDVLFAMNRSPDIVEIPLLYTSLHLLGVLCHLRMAALSINTIRTAGKRRQTDRCRHWSSTYTGRFPVMPTRTVYHVVKVRSPPRILSSHRKGGVSEVFEAV